MNIVKLILLVAAAILFALSTFNVPSRVNLIAGGLLAWVLVPLLDLATDLD